MNLTGNRHGGGSGVQKNGNHSFAPGSSGGRFRGRFSSEKGPILERSKKIKKNVDVWGAIHKVLGNECRSQPLQEVR